ncbi:probable ATP-dependent RNA helicase DDX49 [Rhizophagus clarus]|uniref:Probable ATP-dependent RNA helicase DDX49 n=1 Tax=Rhizophagus clarus TaxID=94130 RepID=A0A8H3R4G7_9GLOM|nr:probable ATP-dependent RNA helicase DDX49 [Rhizophagus clarus]
MTLSNNKYGISLESEEFNSLKTFEELGLNPWLIDALKAMSIKFPSAIQRACIPPILKGKDCIGGAKTGSGKTAAFALPILQKLSEDPFGVFALVLTPTRELAFQIADQFRVLGKTTPGRLVDHINSSAIAPCLSRIRFLVLDEADRLLSDTFAEDLATIFDTIPKKRQTLLFTATMTESILQLQDVQEDPGKKTLCLSNEIRYINELTNKSTIIFCGRCRTAELLRVMLVELDIRCTSLHSTMSQKERLNSLGKFKAEIVRVLIATDVGSRGLDIPTVQLVINFDIPRDPTDYIHRVGRTARAGRGGIALSIVTERDIELVQNIETRINKKMEEWKINENKVLESLNEISTAKRVATMHLHDTNFGASKEIQKKKHSILGTENNN